MATTALSVGRITALDTVRGVAVMGILLLNIVAFGLPEPAYFNPRALGGATGPDLWVYLVNFVLFDGKMRGLFTFLFGASMLLVIERARERGADPARVHFARNLWLLAFGLAHLWLLWWGDILNQYALVALVAWFFRDKPVHRLVSFGIALLVLQFALTAGLPGSIWAMESGVAGPDAAAGLEGFRQGFGVPNAEWMAHQLALYRGGYSEILAHRFETQMLAPIFGILFIGAETLAYMLFGMAAFKTGLLTGAWERRRYRKWLAIGFGVGIPAYSALAWYVVHADFSMFAVTLAAMWLTVPIRPLMVVGWACLILLAMREGGPITTRIAATGRMAFSNYLLTTILCTTFFYGYGFGWFGYLSRAQLYLVVLAVWALMLLWSKPWLAAFRYGPFEWLWRSLSRGRPQAIRGAADA